MSKAPSSIFICQSCGYESRKWLGKCPECGEWNSLVEERVVTTKKGRGGNSFRLREAKAVSYSEIESQDDTRVSSGVTEFDRVLGGGIIVDSIQTTFSSEIESAPGSISQIREVAAQFLMLAKTRGIPVFLIGHVTKEGSIAGPRALEHIVDTVLYFEGERH